VSVAVVVGGLAGFTAYLTLVRGGVDPRSESEGHRLPTTFPGVAVREAGRRRSLRPLVQSVCDRYHPTVEDFLQHVDGLRAASGWSERVVQRRVERVHAVDEGFEFDAAGLNGHGPFRHVLLATGNPGLALPEELREDPRAAHSYEPHGYGESVCVIGAGPAAAAEWLNALAAGATVTSIRRRDPVRRPLNVPRPYLTKRGLRSFGRLGPPARAALLRELLAPSYRRVPRGTRPSSEPGPRADFASSRRSTAPTR
jgi:hypothetical protein